MSDNNNKEWVYEQALDFVNSLDDTLPVEVINDNAQVLIDLERMYELAQANYRRTGSSISLWYLKALAHDLGYTEGDE